MNKSLEKAMEDAWESYRDNNPPKGQARFYYKDNVEYWKDGFRNAISTLKCENCKHFYNASVNNKFLCMNGRVYMQIESKDFGCIEFEKKEVEI